MFRVQGQTTIARSASDVGAFLSDPENERAWQPGIVHLQLLSGRPREVGSRYERVQELMGRKIKTSTELAEFQAGTRVAFKHAGKVIEFRTQYSLAPDGNASTRLEAVLEGEMLGFASMFESVVSEEIEKFLPSALAKLRAALEKA